MFSKSSPSSLLLFYQRKSKTWRKSLDLNKSVSRDQGWKASSKTHIREDAANQKRVLLHPALPRENVYLHLLFRAFEWKWIFGLFKLFCGWYIEVPIAAGITSDRNVHRKKGSNISLRKDQEPHKPPFFLTVLHRGGPPHTPYLLIQWKKMCVCLCIQRPRKIPQKPISNRQSPREAQTIKCLVARDKPDGFSCL